MDALGSGPAAIGTVFRLRPGRHLNLTSASTIALTEESTRRVWGCQQRNPPLMWGTLSTFSETLNVPEEKWEHIVCSLLIFLVQV